MKTFVYAICALACMAMLSACQTATDIDAAIQKSAPTVCAGATTAYTTFVATGLGSEKDKAAVDAAWSTVSPLCANPATITAPQLVVVGVQVAVILKTMRKVKANE